MLLLHVCYMMCVLKASDLIVMVLPNQCTALYSTYVGVEIHRSGRIATASEKLRAKLRLQRMLSCILPCPVHPVHPTIRNLTECNVKVSGADERISASEVQKRCRPC